MPSLIHHSRCNLKRKGSIEIMTEKRPEAASKIVKLVPFNDPDRERAAPPREGTVKATVTTPRSMKWFSRKAFLAGAAILLMLGTGAYFATPYILGLEVTPYVVTRENIVQTVVSSGQLETTSRVEIGSQVMGTVAKVLVQQGDRVKAGDMLVLLDSEDAKAVLDQSIAALTQAKARLAMIATFSLPQAQQALAQNRATILNSKQKLDRAAKLALQGYATRASREDAQRAYDIAESQLRAAELSVKSLSPGGSEVDFATAAVALAQAAVRSSQSRLNLLQVTAPIDGIVTSRNVEPGSVVQASQVLLTLAPPTGKRLVVQIDERSFSLIKIGQKAVASADAFPTERFTAIVSDINPAVDPQRGSVEVKLDVENEPAYLKEDMTVSVDIEVARRANALVLPKAAVRDAAGASPHVLVIASGFAEDRQVKLGTRGQTNVEILSGLVEKDMVIPVTAISVKAGTKVRASGAVVP
jgi:HlyD family secretion protein